MTVTKSDESINMTIVDFKRKKASLLFATADSIKSSGMSMTIIEETLNLLSKESGVSPETPTLFSRLVNALRSLSYFQLTELYGKTNQLTAK